MILVDSCVWIDLLKGNRTAAVRRLDHIRSHWTSEICINSIIYFEVLRRIFDDLKRKKIQQDFEKLERREFLHTGFDRLIYLLHAARRKGIQLVKLGNWLIIKTLLDHNLSLLTSDKDFRRLQRVIHFKMENI